MIKIKTAYSEDQVNEELIKLQQRTCTIIDIKVAATNYTTRENDVEVREVYIIMYKQH